MPLNTHRRAAAPDEIFHALTKMHEGLSIEESVRTNARLIVILANHIGDADVIAEAARIAREPGIS